MEYNAFNRVSNHLLNFWAYDYDQHSRDEIMKLKAKKNNIVTIIIEDLNIDEPTAENFYGNKNQNNYNDYDNNYNNNSYDNSNKNYNNSNNYGSNGNNNTSKYDEYLTDLKNNLLKNAKLRQEFNFSISEDRIMRCGGKLIQELGSDSSTYSSELGPDSSTYTQEPGSSDSTTKK